MRRPLITILAAAALTGCTATQTPTVAATPRASVPATAHGSDGPVPETSEAESPETTTSPVKQTTNAAAGKSTGCPVTAKQLKTASPKALAPFEKIECYQKFAMAVVPESEDDNGWDAAVYVFSYGNGKWKEIGQGSALECEDYMPASTAAHFSYC